MERSSVWPALAGASVPPWNVCAALNVPTSTVSDLPDELGGGGAQASADRAKKANLSKHQNGEPTQRKARTSTVPSSLVTLTLNVSPCVLELGRVVQRTTEENAPAALASLDL
jgi:hypothetical protein